MGTRISGGAIDSSINGGNDNLIPIDWRKVYWRIQGFRIADDRFASWECFLDQPDWLAIECLEEMQNQFQEQINLTNHTNAIRWDGLFNGFSQSKNSTMSPSELLPFDTSGRTSQDKVSVKTKRIILELLESSPAIVSPFLSASLGMLL